MMNREGKYGPLFKRYAVWTTILICASATANFVDGKHRGIGFNLSINVTHEFACVNETGFFPYGSDCRKYVTCTGYLAAVRECPASTVWNQTLGRCQRDATIIASSSSTTTNTTNRCRNNDSSSYKSDYVYKRNNVCDYNLCKNGAGCLPISNFGYRCLCQPGYQGPYCDRNVPTGDVCANHNCRNGATCIPHIYFYKCVCPSSKYTGVYCETKINDSGKTPKPNNPKNPCYENLCQNGAKCIPVSHDQYVCDCLKGFQPPYCEFRPCFYCNAYNTIACDNARRTCTCKTGWKGSSCDNDINECLTKNQNAPYTYLPNINGICNTQWTLSCINLPGSFKCDCKTGIRGVTCNEDVNECLTNNGMGPCVARNSKSCHNHFGTYSCSCKPGYKGRNCEIEDLLCKNCDISHTDHCDIINNDYLCYCDPGWKGKRCGEDVNECVENSAYDRKRCNPIFTSRCLNLPGTFQCFCVNGIRGITCDEDVNECSTGSAECNRQNTARCQNMKPGYRCVCKSGWKGKYCNQREISCLDCVQKNTLTCTNEPFQCRCRPGWVGQLCNQPTNICRPRNPCQNDGWCLSDYNIDRGFRCLCQTGWTGTLCETNINECETKEGSMFYGGCYTSWTSSCQDLPGSYQCKCINGVTGPKCNLDINECKANNDLGPCNAMYTKQCTNFYPGYKCICQEGYKGVHCDEDVDECRERTNPGPNNRGICYDLMTTRCQNTFGSFTCICKTGITGKTCYEDVNECSANGGLGPCVTANTVECKNYFSGYTCICKPGASGKNCEHKEDPCTKEPCGIGGLCVEKEGGYVCDCFKEFEGRNCEIFKCDRCNKMGTDICITTDCIPINPPGCQSLKCQCRDGWSGEFCGTKLNPCTPNSCRNNGRCIPLTATSFACDCTDTGFIGQFCEEEINECASAPCQNGGVCIDLLKTYTCDCRNTGFTGRTCENVFLFCEPGVNPCQNGGICKNDPSGYSCICPSVNPSISPNRLYLFQGQHCEIPVNFCDNHKCVNGGSCLIDYNRSNGYKCRCKKNFLGTYCQKDPSASIVCPPTPFSKIEDPTSCTSWVSCDPQGNVIRVACQPQSPNDINGARMVFDPRLKQCVNPFEYEDCRFNFDPRLNI